MNPVRISVSSRSALVLLMLCCLLGAQWLGLGHRVSHAGWGVPGQAAKAAVFSSGASNAGSTSSSIGKIGDIDLRHSCAAFDDATLPALLTTPPYRAPLLPAASVLALWAAFLSWNQPFSCHFQSRAPPLS
ncbi:hypothetical protein [Noviherbaspirillum suwonense]|uniref:Uncharacterized protein n=1 Tax=Noviherbaspirillum suwonense TaxID=1224511 RepID=A0ABY1PY63_9BURK|nr:hypothetical protein [Noviherbaspirillum suwonense]SMP52841.1 hypothetical protein SAMN06295970_103198 [Noviherbaspirillum suwonense]